MLNDYTRASSAPVLNDSALAALRERGYAAVGNFLSLDKAAALRIDASRSARRSTSAQRVARAARAAAARGLGERGLDVTFELALARARSRTSMRRFAPPAASPTSAAPSQSGGALASGDTTAGGSRARSEEGAIERAALDEN